MPTILPLQPEPNKGRIYLFLLLVFVALFSIALLSGCITEKQRTKICASCPHSDSVIVTKHDTTIVRDTVIFIAQVGDTIKVPIPCPLPTFDIIKKKNGIVSELKSNGKAIECDCSTQIADTVKKIRADHYAEIDSAKEEIRQLPCDKRHHSEWDTFCNWWSGITIALGIILIVICLAKFFMKK